MKHLILNITLLFTFVMYSQEFQFSSLKNESIINSSSFLLRDGEKIKERYHSTIFQISFNDSTFIQHNINLKERKVMDIVTIDTIWTGRYLLTLYREGVYFTYGLDTIFSRITQFNTYPIRNEDFYSGVKYILE